MYVPYMCKFLRNVNFKDVTNPWSLQLHFSRIINPSNFHSFREYYSLSVLHMWHRQGYHTLLQVMFDQEVYMSKLSPGYITMKFCRWKLWMTSWQQKPLKWHPLKFYMYTVATLKNLKLRISLHKKQTKC